MATSSPISIPGSSLTASRNEVHVWRASVAIVQPIMARLRGILSDDERARADRFYFERDRKRFVAARGILRLLLASYLGADARSLDFGYTRYGKPLLTAYRDPRFNVSHSHEMILFAFGWDRDVGVDVEYIRRLTSMDKIAERFWSPEERKAFLRVPDDLKPLYFFTCWTRKEAYIKARGEGLSRQLDSFSVSIFPGNPCGLSDGTGACSNWSLRNVDPGSSDYVAAVAAGGAEWSLRVRDLDLHQAARMAAARDCDMQI